MDTVQAFVLGLMAAWTPSLILLAWLLWRDAGSERQVVSVEDFKARARDHWREWLPKKVKALAAEGCLEEALQGAANLAQQEVNYLVQHTGYRVHEAEEVALR